MLGLGVSVALAVCLYLSEHVQHGLGGEETDVAFGEQFLPEVVVFVPCPHDDVTPRLDFRPLV